MTHVCIERNELFLSLSDNAEETRSCLSETTTDIDGELGISLILIERENEATASSFYLRAKGKGSSDMCSNEDRLSIATDARRTN